MRQFIGAMIVAALLGPGGSAVASGIDKGPYLMHPTPTGITVCWVSDTAVKGEGNGR